MGKKIKHYSRTPSNRKVIKYKKKMNFGLEWIVFFLIFVYIIVILVNYFNKEHISIYEVVRKSISDDNTYKGIVLRDEKVYYTKKAGYLNYYVGDGERVGKKTTIYSVDETGEIYKQLEETLSETAISQEDTRRIRNSISEFKNTYTDSSYDKVNDFKYSLENAVLEINNATQLSSLTKLTKDEKNQKNLKLVSASKSGIITYTMDNKETLKEEDITKETFSDTTETKVQLRTHEMVEEKTPVYKMIHSEPWSIIILLTDEQYKKLVDMNKINITFKKDNLSTTAAIETYEKEGSYFGKLTLTRYVVRYLNDRFLDIELMLNSAAGLKIPSTSIVEKKFLVIPTDYLTQAGSDTGVQKEVYNAETNEISYEFVKTTIYKRDAENNIAYIEATGLSNGDYICNTENQSRYQLGEMRALEGVYNVNKGYAVFRVIHKIYENKEYTIVEEGTAYGLSVYDHIVVNADTIHELQIIGK